MPRTTHPGRDASSVSLSLGTTTGVMSVAGKSKLAAVIAVLHKLVRISFAMLKNNSSYDPNHHPQPSLPTR
jgi:hypothetical protein